MSAFHSISGSEASAPRNPVMSSSKDKKSLLRKVGWWVSAKLSLIFAALIRISPERILPHLGSGFGLLMYHVLPQRRNIGIQNAKLVYGADFSREAGVGLMKNMFRNLGKDMLETTRSHVSPRFEIQLKKNIEVRGEAHLKSALKRGKGVIAVSGHIGNFPIIAAKMASLGYPLFLIAKDPNNVFLVDAFRQWMNRYGVGYIPYKPRRKCASVSLSVLRKNGVVLLLIDQNSRKKYGIPVEFFGYRVPTYGGLVTLAKRTGAATIPLFIHRNDDDTETIDILPEVPLKESGNYEQDLVDNLRTFNRLCESWIKQYPEQWWWVHRRFRHAEPGPDSTGGPQPPPELLGSERSPERAG
jgi:Kdo2-lipid IVA lauroyltransferase/acyltransferase